MPVSTEISNLTQLLLFLQLFGDVTESSPVEATKAKESFKNSERKRREKLKVNVPPIKKQHPNSHKQILQPRK